MDIDIFDLGDMANIIDLNPNKPNKKVPLSIKKQLWKNHFGGNFRGKCFCCGERILRDNFEASHMVSVKNGGTNSLTNLIPLCKDCNRSMGSRNFSDFKKEFFT